MKAIARSLLFALLALAVVSPIAAVDPDELNSITFVNDTGFDIYYLFLSPGDSEWWGADILGSERTLDDGDELGFYIHYPEECNTFDIMAVDEDDDTYIIYDFEICDGEDAEVVFTLDDLADEEVDFEYATVRFRNRLDYDIYYLFISPGDSDMWGVDHLDETTILEPRDTLEVLIPVVGDTRRYDIQAVDEDEDTYSFYIEVDDSDDEYRFDIEPSDMD